MMAADMLRANRIAQWAFDTRPILGRFHLWLEDVGIEWIRRPPQHNEHAGISFVDERMERLLVSTVAVTALGTRLFGQYGQGKGLDRVGLNAVKKNADAISAYAMSECLWYLTRSLPENHAIMVCLGEGLMPKGGETPEMGSNPLLGFGRIYARPQVARYLEKCVQRLMNDEAYQWEDFYREINHAGITIWGTAIETLENTSRFAKGADRGPLCVLHMFDQPLAISEPYEGYVGQLILPRDIVDVAAEKSLLIDYRTPREKVLQAVRMRYPEIRASNLHVWTLRGASREHRIGGLWQEWTDLGVHLIEEGWKLPSGGQAFTDSGTYAPIFTVGEWKDERGESHLLIVDGYAASAEAMQAASIAPALGLDASLVIFSSKFELDQQHESRLMQLPADAPDFAQQLQALFGADLPPDKVAAYRDNIRSAQQAGIPLKRRSINADDFFPRKNWKVMALSGFMLPEPYSGADGVEEIGDRIYRTVSRLTTDQGDKRVMLTFRLQETFQQSQLVFTPLLNRFLSGENFRHRPVKISDSGRIRNELQTLCSEALEHLDGDCIRVHFDRIPKEVIAVDKQRILRGILRWYKHNHPIWFGWLTMDE